MVWIVIVSGFFFLVRDLVLVCGRLIGMFMVSKGVVIIKMIKRISIMFIIGVMLILFIYVDLFCLCECWEGGWFSWIFILIFFVVYLVGYYIGKFVCKCV